MPGEIGRQRRVEAAEPSPLPLVVVEDQRANVPRPLTGNGRRERNSRRTRKLLKLQRAKLGCALRKELLAHRDDQDRGDRADDDDRDQTAGRWSAATSAAGGCAYLTHAAIGIPHCSASAWTILRLACPSPNGLVGRAIAA